jgi:CubicO group peptidase (beta-lactamase class C family)
MGSTAAGRNVADVHGEVATGFEPVREAFAENFERHGEVGAACCVYLAGRKLVDLWGGLADPESGRPWGEDTLALVFSSSKGVTAICVHLLAQRGQLDLDARVADYWPEFGCRGKQDIPIRWVLSHRAGLAAVDGDLSLDEVLAWDPVVAAIAAQAPNWQPGNAHGYHARSFGWILGEIVRRVTGRSLGSFFAEEIAQPLGLDFWVGLPERELARCALTLPPSPAGASLEDLLGRDSLTVRVMSGPSGLFAYDDMWNRPELLRAEMPSSNGVGDARGLARLYAATIGAVDGCRILEPATMHAARVQQVNGRDKVLLLPSRFALGFALPPMLVAGCGEGSFGHPGAGGSLGFADPEAGLGFGYVMNQMRLGIEPDPRAAALVAALYRCLGPRPASAR